MGVKEDGFKGMIFSNWFLGKGTAEASEEGEVGVESEKREG